MTADAPPATPPTPHGHDAPCDAALSVDDVQALLARRIEPAVLREHQTLPLAESLDRVLAQDVVSPLDVPPHDNAAMDGHAFDGALLASGAGGVGGVGRTAALRLRVAGTVLAGDPPWPAPPAGGEAVRIMTGAPMPPGLDTVVPLELSRLDDGHVVFDPAALRRGQNRRRAGEDLARGQVALRAGQRLGPAALGLLASLGLTEARVFRPLRVAYFSTGDELLDPGQPPRPGALYDSNRFSLLGLLRRLGCETLDLGRVGDDPAALDALLRSATARADAIVTSGGVSAGDADHTRAVMQRRGEMAFWQVAMRPGRPMAVGLLPRDGRPAPAVLFGLPGNPVAAMVAFLVFVRPALLRMMGCDAATAAPPPLLRARTVDAIRKRPGRTEYARGVVRSVPGAPPHVRLVAQQGSGVLRAMHEANALVVLPHAQGDLPAGAEVEVLLLDALA